MYAPNSTAHGMWTGSGVTRTRQSSTLFVSTASASARAFFTSQAGFLSERAIRSLLFFDFSSPHEATAALCAGTAAGFSVDFDNETDEKRLRHARSKKNESEDEVFYCRMCRTPVLYARNGTRLIDLPTRKTDGARVFSEGGSGSGSGSGSGGSGAGALPIPPPPQLPCILIQCLARSAPPVTIRRDNGKFETQYPLLCSGCQVRVGYRGTPLGTPSLTSPFTYIHAGALTQAVRSAIPVNDVLEESGHAERKASRKRERGEDGEAHKSDDDNDGDNDNNDGDNDNNDDDSKEKEEEKKYNHDITTTTLVTSSNDAHTSAIPLPLLASEGGVFSSKILELRYARAMERLKA